MNEVSLLARHRLAAPTLAPFRHRTHTSISSLVAASSRLPSAILPSSTHPRSAPLRLVASSPSQADSSRHGFHTTATIRLRSTPLLPANALRKAAAREKARVRALRAAERVSRRREKEGLPPQSEKTSAPTFEGPNGEKLTLAEQEKVLRRELADLSRQLEQMEKKEKTDEATKDLPPLDDQTLDQLYQALMVPPPSSAEDQRLARLESGRKEKALLSAGVDPVIQEREQARLEAQELIRQKILEARDRGRALLPLKPPQPCLGQRKPPPPQPEEDEELDDRLIDLSKLSHEERQKARLQLLFERLTLLRDGSDASQASEGKQQSLSDIKSGLASRIAKILQDHNYLLKTPPPPQVVDGEPKTDQHAAIRRDDAARDPTFESLSLDRSIRSDLAGAEGTMSPDGRQGRVEEPQYMAAANEILQDVSSPKARSLMLDRMEQLLERPGATSDAAAADQDRTPSLPLGIATLDEWNVLSVACARADDDAALARTLKLMRRSGYYPPPLNLLNNVMDVYASRGQIGKCQETLSLIDRMGLHPDGHTYHCLTKAYLADGQYAQAIGVLNSLESGVSGLPPAAMATYTMAIDRMIDDPREEIQALAWNLFYHMRLVAHPIPDAPLYALMLRACAKGTLQPQDIDDPALTPVGPYGIVATRRADTERALDLFREMVGRYKVRPNAEVYNNLILACARRKDFYLESFRLLREMVELERERVGMLEGQTDERGEIESAYLRFAPDRYTFNALLQGCARNRDLPRARWVLAEMIRSTSPLFEDDGQGMRRLSRAQRMEMMAQRPNAETLTHVFWAYASFDPPVKRKQMQKAGGEAQTATAQEKNPEDAEAEAETDRAAAAEAEIEAGPTPTEANVEGKEEGDASQTASLATSPIAPGAAQEALTATEAAQVFTQLVPQTSSDLTAEARALMARILADQPRTVDGRKVEGALSSVTPSTVLLNAYLAVLAHHLPVILRVETLWRAVQPTSTSVSSSGFADATLGEGEGEGEWAKEPGLFAKLGLQPNANTYLLLLETAGRVKIDETTDAIVAQTWTLFRELEETHRGNGVAVDARTIEQCWSQRIRYLAKANRLEEALQTLKQFAALYPPASKRSTPRKPPELSPSPTVAGSNEVTVPPHQISMMEKQLDLSPLPIAKQSLETMCRPRIPSDGGRTAETETDQPPPVLTFVDLELLHHRLVRFQHVQGLAYLGWIARAYEYSRRIRSSTPISN
ncbi:hypothetical protein ACQY0O_007343 [Thecaphora frezii]